MKEHSQRQKKIKVLMVGPYPPPYGGVANFVQYISKELPKYCRMVLFVNVTKNTYSKHRRIIKEIYTFLKFVKNSKAYNEVDIIHIHTASYISFYRNMPYVIFSKKFLNKPVLLHIHGGAFDKFVENSIIKPLILQILKMVDAIAVTSPSWIPRLKKLLNQDVGSMYVIYNGYSENVFHSFSREEARKLLGLDNKKKLIVSVGAYESYKGHRYLVDSLDMLPHDILENSLFVIIGKDGAYKKILMNYIEEKGYKDKFILLSNLPQKDINVWLNAADLFVLPSLIEGLPTVMLESLGVGLPFVGTTVGGIPDVITSEDYGLLCPPKDSKCLAEKILIALEKDWDREKIRKYAEQFTWENIAKQIISVYEKVLDDDHKNA